MDTSHTPKLPRRGEAFTDASARAVWAAILALPTSAQHLILDELRKLLGRVDKADSHSTRVRHAISALREVAFLLGRSPSVDDYRRLRLTREELNLPADSSVRARRGGSWNDCLRQARLDEVPDGDVVVAQNGSEFEREEVVSAMQEFVEERGDLPTFHRYLAWARKRNVEDPSRRRPTSQAPFTRLYGEQGFRGAVIDAGLVDDKLDGLTRSERARLGSYFVDKAVCIEALQLVAKRLGHSPRVAEYLSERERILAEPIEGKLIPLPAASSIQARFDTWDEALTEAGLKPLGGKATRSNQRPRNPAGPRIALDEIVACLVEAYGVCGEPFTGAAYTHWRELQIETDKKARRLRTIPSYSGIWERIGGWKTAVTLVYRAVDLKKTTPDEIKLAIDEITEGVEISKGRKR
jgi:hypothetical protein